MNYFDVCKIVAPFPKLLELAVRFIEENTRHTEVNNIRHKEMLPQYNMLSNLTFLFFVVLFTFPK